MLHASLMCATYTGFLNRALATALFLFVLSGCVDTTPTDPTDASTDATQPVFPDSVRVATWNVRLFYDSFDNPDDDFETILNRAEVQAKTESLATEMAQIDADVFALQEIETLELLESLATRLQEKTSSKFRAYLDESIGMDVGIISRLPIADTNNDGLPDIVSYNDRLMRQNGETTFFARRPLEAIFQIGENKYLSVVSVHFIAMSSQSDDSERRILEAGAVNKRMLSRAGESHLVVVAGDVNDRPDSNTLKRLTDGAEDLTRSVPISERWSFEFQDNETQLDYFVTPTGFSESYSPSVLFHHDVIDRNISDHAILTLDFSIN